MITVSEYRSLDAIAGIRDVWRELWWKTPRASFFQSVEWFECHCRATADVERPRVLVVALAGRPLGLVPWVEKTVRSGVGRIRVVSDPLANRGFFRGPIGSKPKLTLDAALVHARNDCSWDLLELRHIEHGPFDPTNGVRRLDPPETPGTAEESRDIIAFHGDWVEYLRSRPANLREKYQRSERMLAERGRLDYVRYRPEGTLLDDDDPRWELVEELEQAERGTGRRPDGRGLFREMHETAVSIAGVDLNLLRLDGRPIAWAYNYRCDGRIEMQRVRATGEFSSLAACVLLGRMVHDGFRRRDESYLFDCETSRTAGGWQTGRATRCRQVRYSRIGARPRLVRLLAGFKRKIAVCCG